MYSESVSTTRPSSINAWTAQRHALECRHATPQQAWSTCGGGGGVGTDVLIKIAVLPPGCLQVIFLLLFFSSTDQALQLNDFLQSLDISFTDSDEMEPEKTAPITQEKDEIVNVVDEAGELSDESPADLDKSPIDLNKNLTAKYALWIIA